jgi:hypothetical protein
MHRTEGNNNVNNLFTSGPPGTNVGEFWLNAVQEEICNTIEGAGLVLKNAGNDTRDQLIAAIQILAPGATFASGTKMYFYQDAAPSGWTIDAVPADALLAVKGGAAAYNVAGGNQAGTWTQLNHTHGVGTYAVDNHLHASGTITVDGHQHGVGTYAMPQHLHDNGTLLIPNHGHTLANGSAQETNFGVVSDAQIIKETTTGDLYKHDSSGAASRWRAAYVTDTDGGGGAISGNTGNTGPTAITGSSGSTAGTTTSGSSANATATISGTSANGAPANTWRPLAQVGIIATKN